MYTIRYKACCIYILYCVLQEDFWKEVGIEVTEVFKGGSMGHGTTVPGHFDIDLVLYSRSKYHNF